MCLGLLPIRLLLLASSIVWIRCGGHRQCAKNRLTLFVYGLLRCTRKLTPVQFYHGFTSPNKEYFRLHSPTLHLHCRENTSHHYLTTETIAQNIPKGKKPFHVIVPRENQQRCPARKTSAKRPFTRNTYTESSP